MRFFPNLKQLFRDFVKVKTDSHNVDESINHSNVIKDSNVTINVGGRLPAAEKPNVVLSDLEKRILKILAEGGGAAVALGERGEVIQVNMYGHPEQDTVAPTATETFTACRTLLRQGLITPIVNGRQKEYVITDNGRKVAANLPMV